MADGDESPEIGVLRYYAKLIFWLYFTTFHVGIVAAFLLAAWLARVGPNDLAAALPKGLAQGFQTAVGLFFLVVSGGALLAGYAKLWRWLYRSLAVRLLTGRWPRHRPS